MRERRAIIGPLAALALLLPAGDAAAQREPCPTPRGFTSERVRVPLDHSGRVTGRLSLCVQRKAAAGARTGALVVLAGGPGESAISSFTAGPRFRRETLEVFDGALATRDLIVFDQRGTGYSGYLSCPGLRSAVLRNRFASPRGVASGVGGILRNCASLIGRQRHFYTTRDSVEDLELLRRRVGVDRLTLFGVSYGTKVAAAYALRYPDRVERLVLDSVVEPEGPNAFGLEIFEGLPRVLADLCSGACAGITADPVGDLARLVTRLRTGPLRGRVVEFDGTRYPLSLNRITLLRLLVEGDGDPSLRPGLPAAVRSALAGDAAPILRLLNGRAFAVLPENEGDAPALSSVLFVATTCEEVSFPWARTAPPAERLRAARQHVQALPRAAFHPFDRATLLDFPLIAQCQHWPVAADAPALGPGPLPDVPALLVAGSDDLRTPVERAGRMAGRFPRGHLLTVAATGHSVLFRPPVSPEIRCAREQLRRFFADQPMVSRCDAVRRFPPEPVAPRSVAGLPPAARVSGLPGRTLTGVVRTLEEANLVARLGDPEGTAGPRTIRVEAGGLRAGFLRARVRARRPGVVQLRALTLERYSYVPGLTLRGRLHRRGDRLVGSLTVQGRAAARGVLRIDARRRAIGRLGNRSVRMDLGPRAVRSRAASASGPRVGGPSLP